jgi:hypothetical protein
LRLWEKIPTGERSSIIKGAIQTNSNNEPTDRKAEMIKMKLVELERTHAKLAHMNMQREMIEKELMTLRSDGEMLNICKEDFWSLNREPFSIHNINRFTIPIRANPNTQYSM